MSVRPTSEQVQPSGIGQRRDGTSASSPVSRSRFSRNAREHLGLPDPGAGLGAGVHVGHQGQRAS
jgi:hypothetical protein